MSEKPSASPSRAAVLGFVMTTAGRDVCGSSAEGLPKQALTSVSSRREKKKKSNWDKDFANDCNDSTYVFGRTKAVGKIFHQS